MVDDHSGISVGLGIWILVGAMIALTGAAVAVVGGDVVSEISDPTIPARTPGGGASAEPTSP